MNHDLENLIERETTVSYCRSQWPRRARNVDRMPGEETITMKWAPKWNAQETDRGRHVLTQWKTFGVGWKVLRTREEWLGI